MCLPKAAIYRSNKAEIGLVSQYTDIVQFRKLPEKGRNALVRASIIDQEQICWSGCIQDEGFKAGEHLIVGVVYGNDNGDGRTAIKGSNHSI